MIIELLFLKVLMLIRPLFLGSVLFCHYWYFLVKGFRFPPTVCNGCPDVSVLSFDVNNIYILIIHGVDYCCIIFGIRKSQTVYILKILI